jgi:hypothetical protein
MQKLGFESLAVWIRILMGQHGAGGGSMHIYRRR